MGWTYKERWHDSKIEECRYSFGNEPEWAVILKDALIGNTYYAAMRSAKTGQVWALVVLVDFSNNEFGYKDMDETMGPCYYDCPISILNLLSQTTNQFALEWREKCRQNRKRRTA